MKQINFPRPTGYEVIKINNGEFFTLGQILNIKNKVKSIVENAQEVVNENIINNSNLINFVILYEYNRYSDIMQPTNLLDFFSHITNLYNSIQKYDKNILSIKQFDNLDSCYFKNIHKVTEILQFYNKKSIFQRKSEGEVLYNVIRKFEIPRFL